jgi:Tfp pilus assembly PilM family ATPase
MPEKILGLDIGDSSLKAVQVTGGLRGYQVSACARVEIGQEQGLENALKALSEKIELDEGICIASIQADRVSFRNLSMPFRDMKKIGQTINYELEPMLPFSVEAITTDYVVTEDSEKTRILSASVLEETLEQRGARYTLYRHRLKGNFDRSAHQACRCIGSVLSFWRSLNNGGDCKIKED